MTDSKRGNDLLDSLRSGLTAELGLDSGRVLREPETAVNAAKQKIANQVSAWKENAYANSKTFDELYAQLSKPGLIDDIENEIVNQVSEVERDTTGACLMFMLRVAEEKRPDISATIFRDLSGLDALPLFVRPKEILRKAAEASGEERFSLIKSAAYEFEPSYSKYLRGLWVLAAVDRNFSTSPPSDFGALVDQLSQKLSVSSGLIDAEASFFRNAAAHHRFIPLDVTWTTASLSNLRKGTEEQRSFPVIDLINRLFRLVDVAELAGSAQRAFSNETCLLRNGFYREMISRLLPPLRLQGSSREQAIAVLFQEDSTLKSKIADIQRFAR